MSQGNPHLTFERMVVTPSTDVDGEPLLHIRDEGGTGVYRLKGWTVHPLSYQQLAEVNVPGRHAVELYDVTVLNGEGRKIHGEDVVATMNMTSPFYSDTVALVDGGWIPSVWSLGHNRIVMADRNLVTELYSRYQGGRKKKKNASPDFLDFIMDWPVTINPLLYVMEGNARRQPTEAEAREQFAEVKKKLSAALPGAKIMPDNDVGLKSALDLLAVNDESHHRRSRFLMDVAPAVMAPVARKGRKQACEWILDRAQFHGIPRLCMPVLVALSALVLPVAVNPARKMLKPKALYGAQDAYNVLCDIRSLEILLAANGYFPQWKFSLWTKDRNLGLFWSGMKFTRNEWSSGYGEFSLSFDSPLLAGMTAEEWALLADTPLVP
jgi:hypothetical protein